MLTRMSIHNWQCTTESFTVNSERFTLGYVSWKQSTIISPAQSVTFCIPVET